jgi:hypothetical protein
MRAYSATRRVIFGGFVLHLFNDTASNIVRVDGVTKFNDFETASRYLF